LKIRNLMLVALILSFIQWIPAAAQPGDCGDPATFIHDIQGDGETSSMVNQTVTIEGIVTGDFQSGAGGLRGYFVQEEDGQTDSDNATSEGIFVFNQSFPVSMGDLVRVTGKVTEFDSDGVSLTEITDVTATTVCDTGWAVHTRALNMPVADEVEFEAYEGMVVVFPQQMVVTENFDLGRYGSVLLSAGGRLYQPTSIMPPGQAAVDEAASYALRTIILDDANTQQNRDPIPYPAPGLSASNTLRGGDTVMEMVGIIDHRYGAYRIQPVQPVTFEASNPRPVTPPDVGGTVRVAAMNVLNYFNGNGSGGGFPTPRGATDTAEFTRQRDKIINAIVGLDADVISLMEMENDDGPNSAIVDLVNGLNGAAGANTYDFVDTGILGTDEIRVAILYKPDVVELLDWATDENAVFSRPPLAATFRSIEGGEVFTVAVNHFKSKGSCPDNASDPNADQGDGQGCWNPLRVSQAEALTDWLATDPTGSGDPDFLIVGDLNAYGMEDPITSIINDGYVNLIDQFVGAEAYSYVFMGQAGYLDHALASESLAAQVSGAGEWHINADEPRVLDYNREFKMPGQITSLYSSDPFRASDHDPLIVGLNLGQGGTATETPDATVTAGATEPQPTAEPTSTSTPQPPPATFTPMPGGSDGGDNGGGGFFGALAVLVAIIAALLGMNIRRS
jgi:predicted extracellular nuclease